MINKFNLELRIKNLKGMFDNGFKEEAFDLALVYIKNLYENLSYSSINKGMTKEDCEKFRQLLKKSNENMTSEKIKRIEEILERDLGPYTFDWLEINQFDKSIVGIKIVEPKDEK